MIKTWIAVAAAAVLLTGCATAPSIGLSKAELASLKVEKVIVTTAPDVKIWWGRAERDYAEGKLGPQAEKPGAKPARKAADEPTSTDDQYAKIIESPEAKAYLNDRLIGMVKKRLEQDLPPKFAGNRPVNIEVQVKAFTIPSAIQRVAVGGAPVLLATATLKDAKTGATLATLEGGAAAPAGNGWLGVLVDQALADLEDRLMESYSISVSTWLKGPQDEKSVL
jgi:hypothetical protein